MSLLVFVVRGSTHRHLIWEELQWMLKGSSDVLAVCNDCRNTHWPHNWKRSECSSEDKKLWKHGGKEGNTIWHLLQVSWGFQPYQHMKGRMVDISALISWESLDKIFCWSSLGGGFKWSCPELRICPIRYIYCLIPGKGKSLQQFCCQTTQSKGKLPSLLLPENSPLLRSPTLPAFTKDHLSDPGSETVPLIHSKQGFFWPKRGRVAQPRLVPSYRAQRAKEKQEVEVRFWCWESL